MSIRSYTILTMCECFSRIWFVEGTMANLKVKCGWRIVSCFWVDTTLKCLRPPFLSCFAVWIGFLVVVWLWVPLRVECFVAFCFGVVLVHLRWDELSRSCFADGWFVVFYLDSLVYLTILTWAQDVPSSLSSSNAKIRSRVCATFPSGFRVPSYSLLKTKLL